jgi:cobalt-zinc-cadmium resistance protein CzcA
MLKNILTLSLNNRWIVLIVSFSIMLIGYFCFTKLKIEAYPDIADTNVIVIATYQGRAAEEVEQQVTVPIERALQNTPNVLDRRSRTIFGLSVVQLTFQDGTDDYFARQQVMERIATAELPEGVSPELAPLSTAVGEIFRYVVEAPPTFTPTQLRDLQDWVIKPYLLQTPGIAEVVTFGGPLKQFQILINPDKLRKYNLNIRDIEQAVVTNNQNTGGNTIRRGGQSFAVRGLGTIKNEKDIENIVLKSDNGVPVFIRDVASVEIAPPPPSGILGYTINLDNADFNREDKSAYASQTNFGQTNTINQDNGVEGIVLLRRYENPSDVLKLLKIRLDELQERELPDGVKIRILYDRSFLINHSLETVAHTLFEGVSIVIIILIFFLGSLRSALVVAVTIPFSLLFAFIIMYFTGIPANLLSLGAIDFGIIVDGACVMVEHLTRKYRHATPQEKQEGIIALTINTAQEVAREIFFSVSIIILAYMPILLMTRVEGKLFSPMALTLGFAVIGAMIVSLTFVPALISLVYGGRLNNPQKPIKEYNNIILAKIENLYAVFLNIALKYYRVTVLSGFGLVIILIGLGGKLGAEFLPELDEGSIFLRANFPAGITIQENAKYAPKIREIISKYPQIAYVITQTGRNDEGTDPFPPNRNEILVGLKDYHLWSDTISKKQLLSQVRTDLQKALPSVRFSSGQPIIDQVMEIVTGSAADLAISIVGDDLTMMRQKADSIVAIAVAMEGSESVNIEQEGTQEQLAIKINRENAARYGINVADIQNMIETAIGGKYISVLYDGTKRYDIIVRYLPQFRSNINEIENLLVPSANGSLIPISQLADINFTEGQTNIYRYNNKRMITVRTNIKGRDQVGFVNELSEKIENTIVIPKGYTIIYGGQYENLERASKRLMIIVPLTLMAIFVMLFMLYGNITEVLITYTCLLFAIPGGILALLSRGFYFNISAGVGFVSLFGIAVMTGILIINSIKLHLRHQTLFEAIKQSSVEQFEVRLMVISLAMLGLIPAAISSGIGSDIQRPLATVIIGGLISTLLFAPIMIPALYWWTHKDKNQTNQIEKMS